MGGRVRVGIVCVWKGKKKKWGEPSYRCVRTAFPPNAVRTDPNLGSRGEKMGIATFLVKIGKKGVVEPRLGRSRFAFG